MNMLTIAWTRIKKLPPPEPMPDAMEPPREAFLAGAIGGFCVGGLVGVLGTTALFQIIGRLQ
jgi:hypothetical protein